MPDVPPLLPADVKEDFALRRSESKTANDVLANFDVHGARVLITGASAGMGAEITRALAAHGAKVVGTARNPEKAQAATASSYDRDFPPEAFQLIELDLSSLASVRACADALHGDGETFDLVIANAGVMAGPKRRTVDGFETQLGVNHLGHFLLVNRIAGLLKPGGRVVLVSLRAIAGPTSTCRIQTLSQLLTTNTSRTAALSRPTFFSPSNSTGVTKAGTLGRRPSIRARSSPRPSRT